ncbi:MAG: hypothetical protein ACTSO3_12855, partial [Candidatus Heimdallarchaeaceae archaeon]
MTSRLGNRLWLYLGIIFGAALLAIAAFILVSPVLFMMGIAGLIYGSLPLGASLGFGIPALFCACGA